MAYTPISGVVPQLSRNAGGAAASGYYLKGYAAGTSTPLSMGIDSTPTSTLVKCRLGSTGYPISNDSDETTIFIPYFNASYKLVLYTNSTDADANTTANAAWVVDNITGVFDASSITYTATATVTQRLNNIDVATYVALRGITSTQLADGDTINVTNSGVAGQFVVKTGTVTDNGGTLIVFTDDSNRYAERPYNGALNVGWFGAAGDYDVDTLTGTDDTLAVQATIDAAAVSLATGLFVDQLTSGDVDLIGMHGVTAVDIPSGISVRGDRTSRGFVDIGTSTSRGCIEVGDSTLATFSALCGLERCRIQGNTTVNRITVKFFQCIRKSFFNQNYLYGGWRLLDTRSSWALEFESNYIVSAVESCVYLDNGTANNWDNNRIEVSGGPVVVIDGSGANEPANITIKGGAIQSGSEEGIKGIDVLSLELDGVFLESNNQDGGFPIINLVQGAQTRITDYFTMTGGFCSQGTGASSATFLSADAKAIFMSTEVRGNGFSTLVAASANTRVIEVKGTYPSAGVTTPITGYTEGFCSVNFTAGDRDGYISNFTHGRTRNNTRTVTASTTAVENDNRMLISTAAGAAAYTLRDADFTDGRKITLRKYTGDANAMSVDITGTSGKGLVGNSSTTDAYGTIEIELSATSAFCFTS